MPKELFSTPFLKHLEPIQTQSVAQSSPVTAASGSVPPQRQPKIKPQTTKTHHNSNNLPKQNLQNHNAALAPSLHLQTNSPLDNQPLTIPEPQ